MKGDPSEGGAGRVASLNILLPGRYSWLSTVMIPALASNASWLARGAALGAILALLTSISLATRRPRIARWLGIYGFMGLSLGCWILLRDELDIRRIDPTRAALSAAGFALFALGWGSVRRRDHIPEKDPRVIPGRAPAPYARSSRAGRGIFAVLVLVALIPAVLAWRVGRQDQALFAHVIGFVAAIVAISTAANIAVSLGKWQASGSPGVRLSRAAAALTWLAIFATIGMLIKLF